MVGRIQNRVAFGASEKSENKKAEKEQKPRSNAELFRQQMDAYKASAKESFPELSENPTHGDIYKAENKAIEADLKKQYGLPEDASHGDIYEAQENATKKKLGLPEDASPGDIFRAMLDKAAKAKRQKCKDQSGTNTFTF